MNATTDTKCQVPVMDYSWAGDNEDAGEQCLAALEAYLADNPAKSARIVSSTSTMKMALKI